MNAQLKPLLRVRYLTVWPRLRQIRISRRLAGPDKGENGVLAGTFAVPVVHVDGTWMLSLAKQIFAMAPPLARLLWARASS